VKVKNLPTHVGETLRFTQGDTTMSVLTEYWLVESPAAGFTPAHVPCAG
jgi:hypothetical protein